jgi:hypothetical protein
MKNPALSFILSGALIFISSCKTTQQSGLPASNDFKFTAAAAPEWDAVFKRNHGWFGGDGIHSISLNGIEKKQTGDKDSVLMWFSDTMIGDISDTLLPGEIMINNSVALLSNNTFDSSSIRFYWNTDSAGSPSPVFEPQSPNTVKGEYYWLGDGFVNAVRNNDIYIFGYRIINIPGKAAFGFRQTGNTLIRIPSGERPPFAHMTQVDIPFFSGQDPDSSGSFGSALLVNTKEAGAVNPDGFLYVYGVRGKKKEVIVARVKPAHIEQFDQWRYWNGKNWTQDIAALQPVADRSSNEMSVTALEDGRYIMIFQKDAIGTNIGLRVGSSPVGPFGPIMDVYDVKDELKDSPNLIPYNAKAHPVLSAPGELMISYSINSLNFNTDIRQFPHLYRPRFIRLTYK